MMNEHSIFFRYTLHMSSRPVRKQTRSDTARRVSSELCESEDIAHTIERNRSCIHKHVSPGLFSQGVVGTKIHLRDRSYAQKKEANMRRNTSDSNLIVYFDQNADLDHTRQSAGNGASLSQIKQQKIDPCIRCSAPFDECDAFVVLPCCHGICSICVFSLPLSSCPKCQCVFDRSQLKATKNEQIESRRHVCWKGYKRVPGTTRYAKGSCKKCGKR